MGFIPGLCLVQPSSDSNMAIVVAAAQRRHRAVRCARTNSHWIANLLRSSHPQLGVALGSDHQVYSRLVTRKDYAVLTGIGKKHAIAVGDELWTRYVASGRRMCWWHGMGGFFQHGMGVFGFQHGIGLSQGSGDGHGQCGAIRRAD